MTLVTDTKQKATTSGTTSDTTLYLSVFNVGIRVHCLHPSAFELIQRGYSAFKVPPRENVLLHYRIAAADPGPGFSLHCSNGSVIEVVDDSDLLFFFEKDMTLALEDVRSDLYFIHGAALYREGKGCLLIAPSGSGKSTTAWALLHHGFKYLSDELAPIIASKHTVLPYPHALCLKKRPPEPYGLPEGTIYTSHTIHVPVSVMPDPEPWMQPCPVYAIFFVHYDPSLKDPQISTMPDTAAAAQIYTNALNQLAHSNGGLSVAAELARQTVCFDLATSDLKASCELVRRTMDDL